LHKNKAQICPFITFAAGLVQVVRTKTGCLHVALRGHNSGTKNVQESCSNPQKTRHWKVFKSTMEKKFWLWVLHFLWVTS